MDYPSITLVIDAWIPQFADAGFDLVVESIAPRGLAGLFLLAAIQQASDLLTYCTDEMLSLYVADRKLAGALIGVELLNGADVVATARYDAPAGIGTDGSGIWFSTPNTGTELVRWYVNGSLKIERSHDLATNRSASVVELGTSPGDVVQICIVAGGVVGWWGRIVIST